MLDDARTSLRREIERLERAVAQKNTELTSLNDALKRCKGALELLGDRHGGANGGTKHARSRKSNVDWNSVLARLPSSFTLKEFTRRRESKGKSAVYLRRIAANWAKQGKTKRIGLGKYQKVQQKKARAA